MKVPWRMVAAKRTIRVVIPSSVLATIVHYTVSAWLRSSTIVLVLLTGCTESTELNTIVLFRCCLVELSSFYPWPLPEHAL
jgi:hypothetical protein